MVGVEQQQGYLPHLVLAERAAVSRLENGTLKLPTRPGIGFEGQAALYRIMRDLAA